MENLTRCTRCVMDNSSDSTIHFDQNGYCDYCTSAIQKINTTVYFPGEVGQYKLDQLLKDIKNSRKGSYDCIMGVSGGLDSSYLAYLGYQWGLNVLLVHIDDGFDTEISRSNLEKLVKKTGFDYHVINPDIEQFYALTKAYMYAGVPNLANPQDNALFSAIYRYMRQHHIKYFLSGGNFALECILQRGNTHETYDITNIKDINRRYGTTSINKLHLISSVRILVDRKLYGIQSPRPLNYIDYNRERAFKELYDFCGFEYYGGKHLENVLTAFIQLYWFPKKFGVDKRTSHLSSMIVSGQMTREDAFRELEKPLYDEVIMNDYIEIIMRKLGLTKSEFDLIMNASTHQHTDFKTDNKRLINKTIHFLVERRAR